MHAFLHRAIMLCARIQNSLQRASQLSLSLYQKEEGCGRWGEVREREWGLRVTLGAGHLLRGPSPRLQENCYESRPGKCSDLLIKQVAFINGFTSPVSPHCVGKAFKLSD